MTKILPLGELKLENGFKFIGIDKDGKEHNCVVRTYSGYTFSVSSDTTRFDHLIGWIEDKES